MIEDDGTDDTAALEAHQKQVALDRENELISLRQTVGTVHGRRAIRRIIERCAPLTTPFMAGHGDLTAFNCGERNIGLWLIAEMDAAGMTLADLTERDDAQV